MARLPGSPPACWQTTFKGNFQLMNLPQVSWKVAKLATLLLRCEYEPFQLHSNGISKIKAFSTQVTKERPTRSPLWDHLPSV